MFIIDKKTKTIHCTRGDHGAFNFNSPISDENGYLKYLDTDGNVYWYDATEKTLYDSDYYESNVELKTLTLELYEFNKDDVVRFRIMKANKCDSVLKSKDIIISEPVKSIRIELEKDDTKLEGIISKIVDYWYEIELNPDTTPKTILGFDKAGAKIFKLYPEGDDINANS